MDIKSIQQDILQECYDTCKEGSAFLKERFPESKAYVGAECCADNILVIARMNEIVIVTK